MNNTKIKILYIHHGKGLGGAPLSLLYLIQSLDKSKYHPIVLFLHDSEVTDLYKKNGIETAGPVNVMDFPHTKIWWFRWYHLPYFLKAIKDTLTTLFFIAPKFFKEIKPDIVHLNTSSLIAWGIVAKRKKIPVVWHIREPLADGYCGLRKKFIQWCVKHFAQAIVPISHSDATPWARLDKTSVIHNPVSADRFNAMVNPQLFCKEQRLDIHSPKILFLGGLSREKGTHVILEIFTQVIGHIPNAQLLIAGNTSMLKVQTSCLKQLLPAHQFALQIANLIGKLGPNITLLGTIHDVPAAMAASTVIVFPATVGHFARPIIEAGFMQKPVVASHLPPLDELVIDQQTGFLIDPQNNEAWTTKLVWLLKNQAVAQKIGHAAYQFCTANFNLDNYAEKIHTIYRNVSARERSNGHATVKNKSKKVLERSNLRN